MYEEKTINKELVGRNIHYLREKNNYTVEAMSDIFIISTNSVYKWQRGETLPTIENLYKLSRMFEVSLDEILNEEITNIEENDVTR